MSRQTLCLFVFLVIFQIQYFVEAAGVFEVNENDVIESEFKYILTEWSKEATPEEGVWRLEDPDGPYIECKKGGTLRYIKMRDGSQYFQLHKTVEKQEEEITADGGTMKVTRRVLHGDPVALLTKGIAAIHLSLGATVIISLNDTVRIAYSLKFQSVDDARDFANFFDKLRTDSLPVPME